VKTALLQVGIAAAIVAGAVGFFTFGRMSALSQYRMNVKFGCENAKEVPGASFTGNSTTPMRVCGVVEFLTPAVPICHCDVWEAKGFLK
jgi:hypothetical protein